MTRRDSLVDLISEIRRFRVCGPSDDPDKQTAVAVGCRHLLVKFKRLAGPLLPPQDEARLKALDIDVRDIYSVYDAWAEVDALLPDIEAALKKGADVPLPLASGAWIVERGLLARLESNTSAKLDSSVLVRVCNEINSCWSHGNIVATVLLMRAVLNYVPPIYGYDTFGQVVANSGRSIKASLTLLEDGLRKIADFHTHRRIGPADSYPSTAQVEPFKAPFELLLQDLLERLVRA